MRSLWPGLLALSLLVAGCNLPLGTPASAPLTPAAPSPTQTATQIPPSPTATPTPTETPFPEPEGCRRPPQDYSRVQVNGEWLNQRTYWMLQRAAELYGGVIDVAGSAITQGGYRDDVEASFGTHAGGGAVDLSVLNREKFEALWDEVPPLISALRVAGFAAWLRDYGELGEGSPIHIHAIAIGDAELSFAAQAQLTGEFGYLRGFNGLPEEYGGPIPDPHGGPVICRWMFEMGYADLRTPTPAAP